MVSLGVIWGSIYFPGVICTDKKTKKTRLSWLVHCSLIYFNNYWIEYLDFVQTRDLTFPSCTLQIDCDNSIVIYILFFINETKS